jgi:PilZ domain
MHKAAATPRRAHRYEIRTDVRFRPVAVQNWHFGETENISDTGLLVRAPEGLPVDTPIQLELYAPAPISGMSSQPTLCSGHVVRSAHTGKGDGVVRLAIALHSKDVQPTLTKKHSDPDPRIVETFHALNNQLTVVVGTTELLLSDEQLDEMTVARLRKIKDVTLGAATTVKRLLT